MGRRMGHETTWQMRGIQVKLGCSQREWDGERKQDNQAKLQKICVMLECKTPPSCNQDPLNEEMS